MTFQNILLVFNIVFVSVVFSADIDFNVQKWNPTPHHCHSIVSQQNINLFNRTFRKNCINSFVKQNGSLTSIRNVRRLYARRFSTLFRHLIKMIMFV
ncbi:uncharacterized protein CELE_C06C3.10 [Caenorhabditis elegans]|uniref:Secreted protein n=1 Tax=Caenorhabditis elegans TaxID=6239 RepID=A5JYR0_CAEEL|nr:Secreted protein [Caenorhabditis elegans]CAN86591.1 Secreted protein [Caenorhabditis elegans]|eukprot:NP_001122579.1 Uncharacterized protein CELE_C06C3.10 [Caenorhabditis elegans]